MRGGSYPRKVLLGTHGTGGRRELVATPDGARWFCDCAESRANQLTGTTGCRHTQGLPLTIPRPRRS
jgi:hypothetical protein